ncbi:ABC transporter ATP-binding protein [Salinispora oceanensis]|uniref:ABC transporter ATP-binding protein n=1 Tax=Salinispora oceanensis TaxID=1050199 RepID=UPI000364C24D|nr:ABC transporter ATP-binding protein [Salinispora oceanensis]
MSDVVLRLAEVERVYRAGEGSVWALAGVSLTVRAGELVAVMGPSGSGKSTLLSIAGGLEVPTSGSVEVAGVGLGGLDSTAVAHLRRDRIGYVFQDLNLVTDLTAAENVALPLELGGSSARAARAAAVTALDEVGLPEVAGRFPDQLSGGQQQRVAIARALVGERRLVLADEPTGALDSRTSLAVLQVLRARIDAGAAGVLVTHEARYAGWADRTVFLRDGRLVDATPERDDARRLLTEPS